MKLEVQAVIDRPVAEVFQFYAVDHVRNHPRWDPNIEMEPTPEPIRAGTVIRRKNRHSGTQVDETMEITEFEPNRVMGGVIRSGPVETRGRATLEEEGDNRTLLTISAEIPGIDDGAAAHIRGLMERSISNIKRLVENGG